MSTCGTTVRPPKRYVAVASIRRMTSTPTCGPAARRPIHGVTRGRRRREL